MTQEPIDNTDAAEEALADAWENWERLELEHQDAAEFFQEFHAVALHAIARALIEIAHGKRPRGGTVKGEDGYLGDEVTDLLAKWAETADPNEEIQALLDFTDIVALIQEHVDLKRTGTDHRGPCPFHGGKHRNFSVIPKGQIYYCYVCHESGNAIDFLMKQLRITHSDALQRLRERRDGIADMEPIDDA